MTQRVLTYGNQAEVMSEVLEVVEYFAVRIVVPWVTLGAVTVLTLWLLDPGGYRRK